MFASPFSRRLWPLPFAIALAVLLTFSVQAFAAVAVDPTSGLGLLIGMLDQAGLSNLVKSVVCAVTVASALDAALPQPAPGSHWLVIRKSVSFIALNLGNASNSGQPAMMTWIARVLQPLVDAQIARTAPPKTVGPDTVSPSTGPATQPSPIATAMGVGTVDTSIPTMNTTAGAPAAPG
jgi:hypothetical protein